MALQAGAEGQLSLLLRRQKKIAVGEISDLGL
jgi:hypothetical protein